MALPQKKPQKGEPVLDKGIAWLVTDILSDNEARTAAFGRGGPLEFDFPVAAKTGTTRNARDNWTIGYTADRIVGVWVGNADNSPMRGTSGVTGAGPIFHDVMLRATRGLPQKGFPRPENFSDIEVCRTSGQLKTTLCPVSIVEHFLPNTMPTLFDQVYRQTSVDRRNGLLATENCPPDIVEQRVFTYFPVELLAWAKENNWPVPPVRISPLCEPITSEVPNSNTQELTITSPHDGGEFIMDPLIPNDREILPLRTIGAAGPVQWFVNNIPLAEAEPGKTMWKLRKGTFHIRAVSGEKSAEVRITVHD